MANINKGRVLLKLAAKALLLALKKIPVAGAVVEFGIECWKVLRDEQEQCAVEERIAQLEQAAACTPAEAQQVVAEVVQEAAARGEVFAAERVEAVWDLMAVMPAQIQNRTRATLSHAKRLGTAPAVALPVTNRFADPEREAFYTGLFPQRYPQFRAGDELPGADDWHLERLIGAGGFGEVWLARNGALAWAVKFCQDEVSAKLLLLEKKNLTLLMEKLPAGTANVVALLSTRFKTMPYWLAFEYIDGGTLESRMRLGAMSWPEAWTIFKPLLEGMAHVHKLGIVHRDLKPANILLDAQQRPRIADFGIGKILAVAEVTALPAVRRDSTVAGYGTAIYMSPEQRKGQEAHPADDVYALGVILWQMLAGQLGALESDDDIDDLAVADAVKTVIKDCRRRRDKRINDTAALLVRLLATQQAAPSPVKNPQIVAQQEQSSSKPQSQAAAVSVSTPSPKPGESFRHKLQSGGQGPEMVMLPIGKFRMGGTKYDWEKPIHEVTIAQEFAIGKYQVTFDDYDAFCSATSRQKPGDQGWGRGQRPVINVRWEDAVAYCVWLSKQTGHTYRLPSEAEWEYACRAGTTTDYSFGDDAKQLSDYAWFSGNSGGQTHPVGDKLPNPWGLYDMHGNVWEWCQDKWHGNYDGAPTDGSAWESGGSSGRLLRGCSWNNIPGYCRAAYRSNNTVPNNNLGFRVVFRVAGRAV